jgi:uncharacterized phage protein (TIGR02220 family)
MNHYPHHIGDYLKDTAHLDPLEDGIYRRMLDLYYTQEGPLDANLSALCRRLRLDSRKHGEVVQQVLSEFFQVNEAGTHWHHKRCDSEIAKYQAKADANRRNGKAGGRPKQTDEKPKNNPDGFQDETQTITQKNLNQNQNQNQNQLNTLSGRPDPDPPEEPKPQKPDYSPQSREVLEYLNQLAGKSYRPVKANLDLITARLKEGFSVDDLCAVVQRKTEEWQGKPDMDAYLRPETLFGARKFAQYSGQLSQSGVRVDA